MSVILALRKWMLALGSSGSFLTLQEVVEGEIGVVWHGCQQEVEKEKGDQKDIMG